MNIHISVHGNWGEWKKVGACSVTCGGGKQVRRRTCDDPKPAYGGDNCKGADRDEIECKKQDCLPGKCLNFDITFTCNILKHLKLCQQTIFFIEVKEWS